MQKSNDNTKKLNNEGFTLLEVLIAIIILALVSIPLLRSFSTVADTNRRSRIQARATEAAESIMEDIKYLEVEQFFAKYYGANADSDGDGVMDSYEFTSADIYANPAAAAGDRDEYKMVVNGTTAISAKDLGLPSGYTVEVIFNPNKYHNANDYNFADLASVSSATSAIYTMNSSMDKEVLATFEASSKDYLGTDAKSDTFFKDKMKRTLYVTIDKKGTVKDADEKNVDLVDVIVSAKYELLPAAYSYVAPANRTVKKMDKVTIYTNATSKLPMQSVYIMYQPLYGVGSKNDIISVDNSESIPCNLYVVAQDINNHKTDWSSYLNKKTLDLTIYEDTPKSATEANMKLRTNVYDGTVKKTKTDTGDAAMKFSLGYYSGVHKVADGENAAKLLSLSSLDGRLFNTDDLDNKIYSVRVDVYNAAGETLSTIKGSKLEQ